MFRTLADELLIEEVCGMMRKLVWDASKLVLDTRSAFESGCAATTQWK